MLTRTAARRSAAVLMVALVAMLLVATGGSARAAQTRTSVGTGHASPAPQGARQVAAVPVTGHDTVATHLDLASTPATDVVLPLGAPSGPAAAGHLAYVPGERIAPVGRAPPTV